MKHVLLASLLLAGCFKATIQLRPPSGAPRAAEVHSLSLNLIGIVHLTGATDVNAACHGTPEAIEDSENVVAGIINLVLGTYVPVLSAWDEGVVCGAGGASPVAPPSPG